MTKKEIVQKIRQLMAENRRIWALNSCFYKPAFINEQEAYILRMELERRFRMNRETINEEIFA
jgi:hypothetical protein